MAIPTASPPRPAPLLRDATAADLPTVTAIYAHHVLHGTASFEEAPPSLAEMTARFDAIAACGLPYLVAEADGRVAGYAYASLYRTRSAYRFTLEDSIYIDHGMQRRGLGRALLAQLLARSEALGYRQMIAVIGDSQQAASIGLHRALGFEYAGVYRSVGFKFGRWLDTVLMQRSIGGGDRTVP
jgi:L-amino acid N-acyltransferase YncA